MRPSLMSPVSVDGFLPNFCHGAFWDKDVLIRFWCQKIRGHIIAVQASSTRCCCRVQVFSLELCLIWHCYISIDVSVLWHLCVVVCSSSIVSSSLPAVSQTCEMSTSVCPTPSVPTTRSSDELNRAAENSDVRLHCDSRLTHVDGTDQTVATTDLQKPSLSTGRASVDTVPRKTQASSLSTSYAFADTVPGKTQASSLSTSYAFADTVPGKNQRSSLPTSHAFGDTVSGKTQAPSLSTSSVFEDSDSRQLRPLFPTSQTFAAADPQPPQQSFQTCPAFPVTGRESQLSRPTGQASAVTETRNSRPSLSALGLNGFSSVRSAECQLSGSSKVNSTVNCEPTAAAPSISHVCILYCFLSVKK